FSGEKPDEQREREGHSNDDHCNGWRISERVEEEAFQDGCGEREKSSKGRQLPGEGASLLRGRHGHQHRLLCRDPRGYRDSEEDREKNEVEKVAGEVPSHEEEDGEELGEGKRLLRAEPKEHPGCRILGGDNGEVESPDDEADLRARAAEPSYHHPVDYVPRY